MTNSLTIETAKSQLPRLKLIFQRLADRWFHQVVIVTRTQPDLLVLSSAEGNSQQTWPPSPPLQDASYHQLENGAAVLAVGMAGKSHWSASFSIGQGDAILADVACLTQNDQLDDTVSLGSKYDLGPSVQTSQIENGQIVLVIDGKRLLMQPLAGDGWSSQLELSRESICLFPQDVAIQKGRPTRWGFRLIVENT